LVLINASFCRFNYSSLKATTDNRLYRPRTNCVRQTRDGIKLALKSSSSSSLIYCMSRTVGEKVNLSAPGRGLSDRFDPPWLRTCFSVNCCQLIFVFIRHGFTQFFILKITRSTVIIKLCLLPVFLLLLLLMKVITDAIFNRRGC